MIEQIFNCRLQNLLRAGLLFPLIFFFFLPVLAAETLTLNDGRVVEGKVVEDTDEYIRIIDEAGYIYKYAYSEIQEVAANDQFLSQPLQPEAPAGEGLVETDDETAQVMTGLQKNLKRTEHMIQDTLHKLYALPSGAVSEQPLPKAKADQLQQERDNKYRQHQKYY